MAYNINKAKRLLHPRQDKQVSNTQRSVPIIRNWSDKPPDHRNNSSFIGGNYDFNEWNRTTTVQTSSNLDHQLTETGVNVHKKDDEMHQFEIPYNHNNMNVKNYSDSFSFDSNNFSNLSSSHNSNLIDLVFNISKSILSTKSGIKNQKIRKKRNLMTRSIKSQKYHSDRDKFDKGNHSNWWHHWNRTTHDLSDFDSYRTYSHDDRVLKNNQFVNNHSNSKFLIEKDKNSSVSYNNHKNLITRRSYNSYENDQYSQSINNTINSQINYNINNNNKSSDFNFNSEENRFNVTQHWNSHSSNYDYSDQSNNESLNKNKIYVNDSSFYHSNYNINSDKKISTNFQQIQQHHKNSTPTTTHKLLPSSGYTTSSFLSYGECSFPFIFKLYLR